MSIKTILTTFFILITSLLFGQQNKDLNKRETLELPLTIKEGYSGLTRWGGKLDWASSFRVPTIEKIKKPASGIPGHWTSSFVNLVFMDYKQFMYQNMIQENMTRQEFDDLVSEPSQLPYSEQWINCTVSVAVGKTKSGVIEYIIDSNHNNDFADEEIHHPQKKEMSDITSKEITMAPFVNYQLFLNNEVVNYKQRIMICENQGGENLTYNFPYYYETKLNNTPIYISSWFNGPAIEKASLRLSEEPSDNPFDAIEIGNIIEINGKKHTNLGVNFANNILKLEVLPEDPNLESPTLGFKAPNFKDVSLFGANKTVSLSDYKGKYLFLEFWGSWCSPCIEDIPDLKKAYNQTDRAKVEFLSVAFNDQAENLRQTVDKKGIAWPQIFDDTNTLKELYNVTAAPSSFLISPDGKIIAVSLRGAQILPFLDKSGQ